MHKMSSLVQDRVWRRNLLIVKKIYYSFSISFRAKNLPQFPQWWFASCQSGIRNGTQEAGQQTIITPKQLSQVSRPGCRFTVVIVYCPQNGQTTICGKVLQLTMFIYGCGFDDGKIAMPWTIYYGTTGVYISNYASGAGGAEGSARMPYVPLLSVIFSDRQFSRAYFC